MLPILAASGVGSRKSSFPPRSCSHGRRVLRAHTSSQVPLESSSLKSGRQGILCGFCQDAISQRRTHAVRRGIFRFPAPCPILSHSRGTVESAGWALILCKSPPSSFVCRLVDGIQYREHQLIGSEYQGGRKDPMKPPQQKYLEEAASYSRFVGAS